MNEPMAHIPQVLIKAEPVAKTAHEIFVDKEKAKVRNGDISCLSKLLQP